MKKLTKTLIGLLALLLVIITGCKKDAAAPGIIPFGKDGGQAIKNHENYIDNHRGGLSNPNACDEIAIMGQHELDTVIHNEILSEIDAFVTKATAIYRDENNRGMKRKDFIDKLGNHAIIDQDVRRVLTYYPIALFDKMIGYVVDDICYGGGVRSNEADYSAQHLFGDTIADYITHDFWVVTHTQEIYYYYFYFAVNPANYAEESKAGRAPSIREMIQMFPPEEIMKSKDLNEYRKAAMKKSVQK